MIVNRATFIEELTELQQIIAQLLAQLRASEAKKLIMHLYQARKQYRVVCDRPNKGTTAIEREITSSYQLAQSLGFKGDFRAWEHLVRIDECEPESNDQHDRSSVCRTGVSFLDESGDSFDVNITTASESSIHRRPFAGGVPATARRPRWRSIRHTDT
jgi:hypothetical protein